jgi:SAM-dependent methyltransferase
VARRASTVCDCLAVSTLRLADLKKDIERRWRGAASEADIAVGLMPWEEAIIRRFVSDGARVLLVGCGSGRDLLVLAARGYVVTGVDPAVEALNTARHRLAERELSATLIAGFFEDVPISGPFDAVIFSSFTYGYIPESRRRVEALRKAGALLAPGAHIVLSYFANRPPHRGLIAVARTMGAVTRSDWRFEPGDLVDMVDRGGRWICRYAHAFSAGEIAEEAAAAGLRVVAQSEPPDEAPYAVVALP